MFAETKIENASVFAPQAAAVPGTVAGARGDQEPRRAHRGLPLALFALLGMMLLPASNDLITMFVALEILSLPLYLLCGLCPTPSAAVAGGRPQVFPLGSPLLGILHLRSRVSLRLFGLIHLARRSTTRCATTGKGWACFLPGWPCSGLDCCSSSARCHSTPGLQTYMPERRRR